MLNMIQKGERRPLNVTKQGNQRIFVGLSWDPKPKRTLMARIRDFINGRKQYHDLDLTCFLYDENQRFIDTICGKENKLGSPAQGIYHSGDDLEGIGDGDDEQISVELTNLPDNVHHILFKATIQSGHRFYHIQQPEIRLVDAYTKRHLIKAPLNPQRGHNTDTNTYIMAEIFRAPNQPEQWKLNYINTFSRGRKKSISAILMAQYLTTGVRIKPPPIQ